MSHRFPARKPRPSRRGAVIILIAILIPVFIAVAAFSVDVAYMHMVNLELQRATDASARAAGEALSRLQSTTAAAQAAKDLAAANLVGGQPLLLADADIVFGNSTRQANGQWLFTATNNPINSIRINAQRTRGSLSGSVPLFFGPALGVDDFQPVQSATVVRLDRDLCLVVDRSGSMKQSPNDTGSSIPSSRQCQPPIMSDSRWGDLAGALQVFTAALATTPQSELVGLVSYASNNTSCSVVNTVSAVDQLLTTDHSLINNAVSAISSRVFNGSTNIAAGIDNGVVVLTDPARARPFAYKTMILMTDGIYNQGRVPVLAAQDAAVQDVVIHTITFGIGANQTDMIAVANATGGNHYHAPNAAALQDAFREIALTLPVVLAE